MADYKNIQDVLPDGFTKLWVKPSTDKNTDEHKRAKTGSWMYYTKRGDEYFTLFAKEEEKSMFDSGEVWAKCGDAKTGGRWIVYHRDGDIETLSHNQPVQQTAHQQTQNLTTDKPDWDAIALGKCRSLIAVKAFEMKLPATKVTADNIELWAKYMMTGSFEDQIDEANKMVPDPVPQGESIDVSDLPF